jgi:hypothetical protein
MFDFVNHELLLVKLILMAFKEQVHIGSDPNEQKIESQNKFVMMHSIFLDRETWPFLLFSILDQIFFVCSNLNLHLHLYMLT